MERQTVNRICLKSAAYAVAAFLLLVHGSRMHMSIYIHCIIDTCIVIEANVG